MVISERKPVIGIFGGTFDPVHTGHIQCALSVQETFHLDKIFLMPCAQSPHKQQSERQSRHRCKMAELAIADYSFLAVDKRECLQEGKSYTYNSLLQIRQELGESASLLFILGFDAFLTIEGWRRWKELLSLCHLLVINRPGYQLDTESSLAHYIENYHTEKKEVLLEKPSGYIYFHNMDENLISSTEVRKKLLNKQNMDGEIPDVVISYIKQHQLY